MKKSISVLFCLVLLLSVMVGCGNSAENDVRPGGTDTDRPGVNDNVDTGNDGVVIYLAKEKAVKKLPANRNIRVDRNLLEHLYQIFGESRVKVVEKSVEIR